MRIEPAVEGHGAGYPDERDTDRRLGLYFAVTVVILAGAAAPTPLYEAYAERWGGTTLTTTIAFSVYAGGVMAGLLVLGRLSAHLGRKPVIVAGLLAQLGAMVMFILASGYGILFTGRGLQGLAVGALLGALGDGMTAANRDLGPVGSAAGPGVGTAIGAVVAGVMFAFLPWPTQLVYLLTAAAVLVLLVLVLHQSDPTVRRPGARQSLVPQVAVPLSARRAFTLAAPVCFAAWSIPGFYSSLAPRMVSDLTGSSPALLGGAVLAAVAALSAIAAAATRGVGAPTVLGAGAACTATGGAVLAFAAHTESALTFAIATVVAGLGAGAGLQGGTRYVVGLVNDDQRASLLSAVFVVAYLGNGLPVIVCGYLAARGHDLLDVVTGYGVSLLAVGCCAMAVLLIQPHRRRCSHDSPQ